MSDPDDEALAEAQLSRQAFDRIWNEIAAEKRPIMGQSQDGAKKMTETEIQKIAEALARRMEPIIAAEIRYSVQEVIGAVLVKMCSELSLAGARLDDRS